MKWIAFWIALPLVATGSVVLGTMALSRETPLATPVAPRQQTKPAEEEDEDFIPTEKVPADSAISFPVDI